MLTVTAQTLTPFISPALAWAGLAAVSIPVAIHLLSRWRRRPQPWGAMRFLLEAYRKQKRRMRLEQWLLLLTRCLIVLLLGLSLARPRLIGSAARWLGGLDQHGRVVDLVIDDSMSTFAPDGRDATRFDRLIHSAHLMVDALGPGDRATIWRAGRPASAVIAQPTADRDALHQALKKLRPGYSRPDLPRALEQIARSSKDNPASSEQRLTVLLSDFASSSEYLTRPPDSSLGAMNPSSGFVAPRPLSGLSNTQVLSVEPNRRVVVLGGEAGVGVPARVRVQRYSERLSEESVSLTISLIDRDGRRLSAVKRPVTFSHGQGVASVNVTLPLSEDAPTPDWGNGKLLTIRAQLVGKADGLTADDQSDAVVELRSRLRVAVVDEPVGLSVDSEAGLSPGQWLRLALRPQVTGMSGPVDIVALSPAQLNDPASVGSVDAVMLLRPDLLFESSWDVLASYADRGGVVWVFTPAVEGTAVWVEPMIKAFGADWRVGLEPVTNLPAGGSWNLSADRLQAEAHQLLAADWQALSRPVRIIRRLPVDAPRGESWIRLSPDVEPVADDNNAANEGADTVLASHNVGRGSLLFLSTAVDTRWTNLPTKPLFVPLIHETLRGVLGAGPRPGTVEAVAGDLPDLDSAWSGVAGVDRLVISGDLVHHVDGPETSVPGNRITLSVGERGEQFDQPVDIPGVYLADGEAGPCRLIVNVDPKAGDTRQVSEEILAHWLDGLGDWRWLDEGNPGSALDRPDSTSDLGWALLWALLVLVLIETVLARILSHAHTGPGRSLTGRLFGSFVQLRSEEKSADGGRGRAA